MYDQNPFLNQDTEKSAIWELLVTKQTQALTTGNWDLVVDDYLLDTFIVNDAGFRSHPDHWRLLCSDLPAYRNIWQKHSQELNREYPDPERLRSELFRTNIVRDIDICGERATVHQVLESYPGREHGEKNLVQLCKICHMWKIAGLVVGLPLSTEEHRRKNRKSLPQNAEQHATAGPYSPVLCVNTDKLVVIAGQAPLDNMGNVIGDTIEEQTAVTLENCRNQLKTAGVDFSEVFKVNVYLTDLNLWSRFNEVYRTVMPQPFPVRTAVATGLLHNFLVEIEMWAVSN